MIIQDITSAAENALTISAVVGSVIGGVIGNKSDLMLIQTHKLLYNRFKDNLNAPGNHDIAKAVREAYLKASLIGCKAFIKKEYGALSRIIDPEAREVKSICKYLREELNNVKLNKLKNAHYSTVANFSLLLDGENGTADGIVQLRDNLVHSLFEELHWYTLSESFKTHFISGWKDGVIDVKWFDLISAFFAESLKTNSRLSAIVTADLLKGLNSQINNLNLSEPEFEEHLTVITNHYRTILDSLIEIMDMLEVMDIKLSEIIDSLNEVKTNQLSFSRQSNSQIYKKILRSPTTLLPEYPIGRLDSMDYLIQNLPLKRLINICGEGGLGKTTLATMFWDLRKDKYMHLAWLSCQDGVLNGLFDLTYPLRLQHHLADSSNKDIEQILLTALINFEDELLIVFDDIKDSGDIFLIERLLANPKIQIIVTSRCITNHDYYLDRLNYEEASRLFQSHFQIEILETSAELSAFFELVGYNTLCIEIFSKSIKKLSFLGETLAAFFNKVKAKGIFTDYNDLSISTGYHQKRSATVADLLNELFDQSDLSRDSKYLLLNLALLPSDRHSVTLLLEMFKPSEKVVFLINLESLANRGWVSFQDNACKLSPVVQQMILNKARPEDLKDCDVLISNLTTLIDEDNSSIDDIVRTYEPIAQSVLLNAIGFSRHLNEPLNNLILDLEYLSKKGVRIKTDLRIAYSSFEKYIKLKENGEHRDSLLDSYITFCKICAGLFKIQEALYYQLLVVQIYEGQNRGHKQLADAYLTAGILALDWGNNHDSLVYTRKALSLFSEFYSMNSREIFPVRGQLLNALAMQNTLAELEEGKALAFELVQLVESDFRSAKSISLFSNRVSYKFDKRDYGTNINKSNILLAMSLIIFKTGDSELAKEINSNLLEFYEQTGRSSSDNAQIIRNNLSLALMNIGGADDLTRAESLLRKNLLSKAKAKGEQMKLIFLAQLNLAIILGIKKQYDEAILLLDAILNEDIDMYNIRPKAKFQKAHIIWITEPENYASQAIVLLQSAREDVVRFEDDYSELVAGINTLMAEIQNEIKDS